MEALLEVHVHVRAMRFVIRVDCGRGAVSENRKHRAYRNSDGAHRPDVHDHRNAKGRSDLRRERSAEPRNATQGEQEARRADWKAEYPSRQALDILLKFEQMRRSASKRVSGDRCKHEADGVDERTVNRTEDHT